MLPAVALAAVVFLGCALQAAGKEPDWSTVEVRSRPVAGQVHFLWARGGNIGVFAGADGILLVDDQFAPLTGRILATIRAISSADIRFLINTHVHPDHTGGNENFGRLGTVILAHDSVRVRLAEGLLNKWTGEREPGLPWAALPILTYSERVTFHMNGEAVDAFVVPPAHTDGDSFVHFRGSDVMHLGDVLRTSSYPIIDRNHGGSYLGMIDALSIAIDRAGPNTRFIQGHGPVVGIDAVRTVRDMLIRIRDNTRQLVDQGKTLEEVLAARPSAEFDDSMAGDGYSDPEWLVSVLYGELTGR